MKTLAVLRDLAAIAALAAAALVLFDVHRVLIPQTNLDLQEFHRLTLEAGLTAKNVREATAAWQASSKQQAAYFTSAASETTEDLTELKRAIGSVQEAAAAAGAAIAHQDAQLAETQAQARASLAALQSSTNALGPLLANASAAAGNAAKLSADPHLAATLANLDATTQNTAAIAANMDATAADIRAFVHRETTPVRGTWNVIKGFLQSFAGPAAQVATAAK